MAAITFTPSTRTIDPPDLIVLAAVAALATAKAVRRFRAALGPVWVPGEPAVEPAAVGAVPSAPTFDEDLMDRFLTAPTDLHDPEAGRLRRRSARRQAGAEAQWRILAQ
ncbi:MAG: hypothetical protein R2746_17155 [Acidimicrobiales bacterium]|nr:hypothetical protein [Actinomycetota bacterium]